MAHQEQVSILSHMHLQQVEDVRAQSQEIQCLYVLVKKQQEAIEHLSIPKGPTRHPWTMSSHSKSWFNIMRDEIFNIILRTVNMRQDIAVASNSPSVAPIVNRGLFGDMLAEEVTFTPSHQPRCVKSVDTVQGGLISIPRISQEELALPSKSIFQSHREETGLHKATQKFQKCWIQK